MEQYQLEQAIRLLQDKFGENWLPIVQNLGTAELRQRCGKELTSFMAFIERGTEGSNRWPGNCSPRVVEAVARYVLDTKRYYRKDTSSFTLLDPMSGSGTSKEVSDQMGIQSVLYDLNPQPPQGVGNWDALTEDVEDSADLIFFHPPYHSIIRYSGKVWGEKAHANDLSNCENYADFIDKLNFVMKKLYMALRKDGRLAVLVGDIRQQGKFFSIQNDLMRLGDLESFIVKGQYHCNSDDRRYSKPFIPVVTEYLLLFHKQDALMIPFSKRRCAQFDVRTKDDAALTWNHLIRMTMESVGGKAKLSELAQLLSAHPKSQQNNHFRERIRATIYEHRNQYTDCGNGYYCLNYAVA